MAIPIQMPRLSDTMEEGVILKWIKQEGEQVEPGEILAEVETDKANMELEAFDSGLLLKILVGEGQRVPVAAPIAVLGEPGEDIASVLAEIGVALAAEAKERHVEEAKPGPTEVPTSRPSARIKASPVARRLAAERGIDLSDVRGTGPEGRITKQDVESYRKAEEAVAAEAVPPMEVTPPEKPTPVFTGPDFEDVQPSLMREAVAKRMVQSKSPVPHFYLVVEVDAEPLVQLRESLKRIEGQVNITYNDIIVKLVAITLRKHPWVNASFVDGKIRFYKRIDIGVAVALEEGLITPVIRNCDSKGIGQIAQEIRDMAERAKARKLKPEEYSGATFTVSNLGMYGIDEFAAIINPPESGILAVGAIVQKPVVKDGQIVIGYRSRLTLSGDHRVIDGATGAKFLVDLKDMLENPLRLVI